MGGGNFGHPYKESSIATIHTAPQQVKAALHPTLNPKHLDVHVGSLTLNMNSIPEQGT